MRQLVLSLLMSAAFATAAACEPAQPAGAAAPAPAGAASNPQQSAPQVRSLDTSALPMSVIGSPVSALSPGNVKLATRPSPKELSDPKAAERGMMYFTSFNCVGCHAANGGGGMGPALSNSTYIYGGDPANLYLSIYQGRPNGMPAWGAMLPETVIWDLVAYVTSLGHEPSHGWGVTLSKDTMTLEQVPAEFSSSTTPWSTTEPFGNGQKPGGPEK